MKTNNTKICLGAIAAAVMFLPAVGWAVDATLDLTGGTTSGLDPGGSGAFFTLDTTSPSGSGIFHPFLRMHSNDPVTEGFNVSTPDNSSLPMDDQPPTRDPNFEGSQGTNAIQLGTVGTVSLNGTDYYKFTVDVGNPGNDPLTLSNFALFLTANQLTAAQTSSSTLAELIANVGTPAFQTPTNVDFVTNSGQGVADLAVLVPVSALGTNGDLWLTLYSEFGAGNFIDHGTFEEWRREAPTSVPDGGTTIALLGLSCIGLAGLKRKFAVS